MRAFNSKIKPVRRFKVNWRRGLTQKKNKALIKYFPYYGMGLFLLSLSSNLRASSGERASEYVILKMAVKESISIVQENIKSTYKNNTALYKPEITSIAFLVKGKPHVYFISRSSYIHSPTGETLNYIEYNSFNTLGAQRLILIKDLYNNNKGYEVASLNILYP